jgi:hypothetical protein
VAFSSPETLGSTTTAASGTFGPINLSWYGPTVTTGNLYALQIQNDVNPPNFPVAYKGYGVKTGIAVNDGSTVTGQLDTLQTVSTAAFSATVTIPSGYTLVQKVLASKVSSLALITLLTDASSSASVSYNTPNITGSSLTFYAYSTNAAGAAAYAFAAV